MPFKKPLPKVPPERQDTFPLIVVQYVPEHRGCSCAGSAQADDHFPGQPGKENDEETSATDEQGCTEVRLLGNQGKRHNQ